jgi:hypothetical protein
MAGENWTMWLNITNFALGLVTVIAVLVVFFAVGWDLLVRKIARTPEVDLRSIDADLKALLHGGSHSFSVPELGLTMADGGERIGPPSKKASDRKKE